MRLLQERGYTRVTDFTGGLAEWQEKHAAVSVAASAAVGPHRTSAPALPLVSSRVADAFERFSTRMLVGLWFGTIGVCAVVYWLLTIATMGGLRSAEGQVGHDIGGLLTALYFSFVTATSVGFGDIVPLGAARAVAIAEAVIGLLMFGAVVSKLVSRRQEQIVREIHRIAFEDRLGRVQANLHLVLSEIQTVERLCAGNDSPGSRSSLASTASRASVLASCARFTICSTGRRRSPTSRCLEGILASLSIVLRQLRDLLRCLASRTPYLARNLGGVARIANDICADCVPRRYAPSLREWMDAIQAVAGEIV